MSKATWLLVVNIFVNVCILAYSYTGEMQSLKDLKNTNGANIRRMYFDIKHHPTRQPGTRQANPLSDRLFRPGQTREDMPPLDKLDNPLKYLPKPTTNPSVPYDPNLKEAQLPEFKYGNVPGPGSESEYPNGLRIRYDYLPNAVKGFKGGFGFGMAEGRVPRPGIPTASRQGDDNSHHALRMGQQNQPGMAGGIRDRTRPSEMGKGPPQGYMLGGQPPGMGGDLPPGYMQGGQPPEMRGNPPPWYVQEGQPPGIGGAPLPEYLQRKQSPMMEEGPPPEYMQGAQLSEMEGGSVPVYMQTGQTAGRKGIPLSQPTLNLS